jgi:predicted TIM-barrel fold metal-dependent hydrolase
MASWSRRDTLRLGGGALATSALPGCGGARPDYPDRPATGYLIDAHCHLFNGTDLPITTFLTRLVLRFYDEQRCDLRPSPFRSLTIEDPTLIEELISRMVGWLLRATPTARQELDLLARDHTTTVSSERNRIRSITERQLAAFLEEDQSAPPGVARTTRSDDLRAALWQEAEGDPEPRALRTLSSREAASSLLRSTGENGSLMRWIELFFRSRQSLAQELVDACNGWGLPPLMLVPLMVDYAHWLGETTQCDSSFFDQIAVWGALSRRSPIPIHGMVPFDPLRDVFWTSGKHDRFPKTPEFDPLKLAEEAITRHGFLGLKLYPPMGFRATGNLPEDAEYPKKAVAALNLPKNTLGVRLDAAMQRAFDFCLEHDVPMLAHANNSLGAGKHYARRADPWYWIGALKHRPALRLCLAHAGGFCWKSEAPGHPSDKSSWEWAIGTHVRAHPSSHLYMHISYLSEIFESDRLDYIAGQMKDWIRHCDPDVRHIIFGTDWIMLDKATDFSTYGNDVIDFLTSRCNLTADQLDRVMWQNAFRFFGLDNGKTRDRLLRFYDGRTPDWTTLSVT